MKTFKTTWRNIRRSPYQAFAAVFVMFQTFFVISIFAFLGIGSARTINYLESLPQVDIFFKTETKQEDIDAFKKQLDATGKIEKIKFTSQEEALKIYHDQNKNDPLLLELVTADYLPASFHVAAVNVSDLSQIVNVAKTSSIVHEIVFPKDVISKLVTVTDALRKIGIFLIIFLLLDSIFIMMIIISIKISQKKEDISIMKLIGASSWYIRWPFIVEGMLYGVVGSVLGWIVAFGILLYATPALSTYFAGFQIFPLPTVLLLELLGAEIMIAIILGIFSSFAAVLRYLK